MTPDKLKARWASEDKESIDSAIDALLKAPNGRKALWWLLEIGQIGRQPFSTDPHRTAFECGQLNVGQQVLARITSVSPEGYMNMMKEMADERSRRDNELTDAARSSSDAYATESGAVDSDSSEP